MLRQFSSVLALLALLSASNTVGVHDAAGQDEPAPNVIRTEVPLQDGRLPVADLLRAVCIALEMEPAAAIDEIDWTIDPRAERGKDQLETIRIATAGVVSVEALTDRAIVTIDRDALKDTTGEAQRSIAQWLDALTARMSSPGPPARVLGVTFVTDADERTPMEAFLEGREEMPERLVILIHGLDDPGWMWDEVAPALHKAGYVVARFEYANDGPIADAADRFAMSLMRLNYAGVKRADIVAHSMGGLVTRDVLTRESYYGGDGTGGERFPSVDRFIMCGTPNHGSELARLRGISEIKEQITRTFSGEGSWMGGLTDGSGEAAVDLLPGSTFLRRLNARPLASHTRHTIIAGRMSPVAEDDVAAVGDAVKKAARSANAPKWLRDWIDSAEENANGLLNEAVRGLGDGCVSIDSARLEGVDDFTLVEANHISMIINITPGSKTIAPALPLILERLGE